MRFEFTDSAARNVCLAGTFNDWRPESSRMIPLGNGRWAKDLALAPGVYEYRIVVDGSWKPDPGADHAVLNGYGERNSLLTVLEESEDYGCCNT